MVGSIRPFVLALGLALAATVASGSRAADDPAPQEKPKAEPQAEGRSIPPVEELPPPFVPRQPRTAEDRDRIEALRDYAAARALEDQNDLTEAIALLEEALKKAPDSVAVLRRLSLLNRAKGRIEKAAEYSRKVVAIDPGDTESLGFLVEYLLAVKKDPGGVETLLKSVLADPNLAKDSPAALLAERDLGLLYVELRQPPKAAEALANLVERLDERAANRLSPADQLRILGDDPAASYQRFGEVFHLARRYDLAIKAFQRGLDYDAENSTLPWKLAQTLLKAGKSEEALATLDPFLKRQPPGREPYQLLAEILTALRRTDEILPRLEEAAKADPKNLQLQYLLADRYRETGQPAKADAILKELVQNQPDPQGIGRLAASLLESKKYEDLVVLLGDAAAPGKPANLEAVLPLVQRIINNPDVADQVLAAGLKLQDASPPKLNDNARRVLAHIANEAKRFEGLAAIQRLVVKQEPTSQNYEELSLDLYRAGRHEESADALDEMLTKHPDRRKDGRVLDLLSQARLLAGRFDGALEAARESLKVNPADPIALSLIGTTLSRMGKSEEAIAHFKDMLDKFPKEDEVVKRAHSGLSTVYVDLEQFDKGEAELEALLDKDPEDVGVNNDLGYLYADRGKNLEKAEAMVRKAVEAEPDNSAYLDSLGWVLFKRGKAQEALEPLEKAGKDPGVDATILDHLGDVYYQLKQTEKARAAWRNAEKVAARAHPPDKRLAEIRKKLTALDKLGPAAETTKGDNP
jgi:tetratricopeptide (TPR) repeat protein